MRIHMFCGRLRAALVLTGAAVLLTGCGSQGLSRTFGFTRSSPDEFTVTTRAPLSMPPNFDLRPPAPGEPRPQEQSETRQAQEALVPQTALANSTQQASLSPGQEALIQDAGPPAPANIRQEIRTDAKKEQAESDSFVDSLLFWRSPPPQGIVVDAKREAQRLRENAALGQSPEAGDTPIIQPHHKGWLDGLFWPAARRCPRSRISSRSASRRLFLAMGRTRCPAAAPSRSWWRITGPAPCWDSASSASDAARSP